MHSKQAIKPLVFNLTPSLNINKARLDHLASLGLPLTGNSVLEVGSGIGLLTSFFEDRGCTVLSTVGRIDNIKENLHLHPFRQNRVLQRDLNISRSHDDLGRFDIVFCYGTLYHLDQPELCIEDLARVTDKFLLLESCVNPIDNGKINYKHENKNAVDQALKGLGCRPARDWIFVKLRKFFKYVYMPNTQPDHHDFPLYWPVNNSEYNTRSIFIASNIEFDLPTLYAGIPPSFTRYQTLSDNITI